VLGLIAPAEKTLSFASPYVGKSFSFKPFSGNCTLVQWIEKILFFQKDAPPGIAVIEAAIALNRETDKPEEYEILEIHQLLFAATEGHLLAVDMALNEVCATRGFDAADPRRLLERTSLCRPRVAVQWPIRKSWKRSR
jgi:hypothetical protein